MRFHLLAFVLSFCIGVCLMLCLVPKPAIVVKFPRPGSEDEVYRGESGDCFKIAARRVSCKSPGSGVQVVPQPVSENEADASMDRGLEFRNPLSE